MVVVREDVAVVFIATILYKYWVASVRWRVLKRFLDAIFYNDRRIVYYSY